MNVQDILKQLEVNEGTFPREAVTQAMAQREAMPNCVLRWRFQHFLRFHARHRVP